MPQDFDADSAREQIKALIEENRLLAETLEALQEELKALERATGEAVRARKAAETKAAATEQAQREMREKLTDLRRSNRQLENRNKLLLLQVEGAKLQPLTAEEVSSLLEKMFEALRAARTFRVRDAEVTLKVATGKLGDELVLILPEPGADIDSATLHEIKLRFSGVRAPPTES